ncbi:MAG: phytanoyl-CoA dioxygenase family protein [Actinomycetota bacterium]
MHAQPLRDVTAAERERFVADGVVKLPAMFGDEWIDHLAAGLDRHLSSPSPRARVWDRDAEGRTMFWDSQAWTLVPEYRDFVEDSPAAAIAGDLMGAQQITFFFDAVFVRSPGSKFSTPWHQDEPYWSVDGFNTCSIWIPLVPVAAESCLSSVPGSHRGDSAFHQYNFMLLNPDGGDNAFQTDFTAIAEEEMPDFDADPDRFGVVSWDMEPGDCIAFNSRIIHGGSGNLPPDAGLRVFTTKWIGDDVVIAFRECGMDPDHTEVMVEQGLGPGDRPSGPMYPTVWTREPQPR